MKRAFTVFTLSLVLLACFAFNFSARSGRTSQAFAAMKPEAWKFRAQGPSLTIVFRGLMVFHTDAARQDFEVGVLKAPEHQLRVQLVENSSAGISTTSLPLSQRGPDVWSLAFPSPTNGVTFYQSGSFDRKNDVGDQRDFRWAVNLRSKEFYDRKLQTETDQFNVVLHVRSGEFYTSKRTPELNRKKGDGTYQSFGRAAQEVATDVSLEEGDMVLRSEKTATEILRLKQEPDTTYTVIIENVPIPQEHMTLSANHFQYYYRLFAIPRAEWYDFRVVRSAASSAADSASGSFSFANYAGRTIRIGSSITIDPDARCLPVGF